MHPLLRVVRKGAIWVILCLREYSGSFVLMLAFAIQGFCLSFSVMFMEGLLMFVFCLCCPFPSLRSLGPVGPAARFGLEPYRGLAEESSPTLVSTHSRLLAFHFLARALWHLQHWVVEQGWLGLCLSLTLFCFVFPGFSLCLLLLSLWEIS